MAADTVDPQDRRVAEHRRWLARHARTIVRRMGADRAGSWSDPRFRRRVEDIHRSLRPIRSRGALVASLSREGALLAHPLLGSPPADEPLAVAYALRWHELGTTPGRRGRPSDASAA